MVRLIACIFQDSICAVQVSIPKMVRLIGGDRLRLRGVDQSFNSKDGAIDSCKQTGKLQLCFCRFNSKDGAIDSIEGTTDETTKPSFNSKDGAIDSCVGRQSVGGYERFNSKDGAIDSAWYERNPNFVLTVSIPKMVRLIAYGF